MGGLLLILSGDFCQTLPVIPRGTRADEIHACLRFSHLWNHVEKVSLTTNMRSVLYENNGGLDNSTLYFTRLEKDTLQQAIDSSISIPQGWGQMVTTLEELKEQVFPNILHNYSNAIWL